MRQKTSSEHHCLLYCGSSFDSVRLGSRFGSVRFGSVRFGSVRYCSVRFDWVRFGSVRFGSVRFGSVRFGSVRFGSVRFGSVRFGSVRFDSKLGSARLRSVCPRRFLLGYFLLAQVANSSPVDTYFAARRHQDWVLLRLAEVLHRGACVTDIDGPTSVVDRTGQPASRRLPHGCAINPFRTH